MMLMVRGKYCQLNGKNGFNSCFLFCKERGGGCCRGEEEQESDFLPSSEATTPGGTTSGGNMIHFFLPVTRAFQAEVQLGSL